MRYLLTGLFLGMTAVPALADDTTTSGLIAEQGLANTLTQLKARPASPDRNMALAATTFLRGIESAYQARWQLGATDLPIELPVIGTELVHNPEPKPVQADAFNQIAIQLNESMQATRDALADTSIEKNDASAVVLKLSDLWFDVNMNNQKDSYESLYELSGIRQGAFIPTAEADTESSPGAEAEKNDEVRFDAADVHWLRAYTHLIQTGASLLLAFDPETEMTRILNLQNVLAEQSHVDSDSPGLDLYGNRKIAYGAAIDAIAVVYQTLRHQPDKALINEAEQHFRDMIKANRDFWGAVNDEKDDDREWIPNELQTQALGLVVPPDAGDAWLSVLSDAERLLNGELLIPHWRYGSDYGIDLRKWLDDPKPIDLVSWLQGTGSLEFSHSGRLISGETLDRFESATGRNMGLYMVLFN